MTVEEVAALVTVLVVAAPQSVSSLGQAPVSCSVEHETKGATMMLQHPAGCEAPPHPLMHGAAHTSKVVVVVVVVVTVVVVVVVVDRPP